MITARRRGGPSEIGTCARGYVLQNVRPSAVIVEAILSAGHRPPTGDLEHGARAALLSAAGSMQCGGAGVSASDETRRVHRRAS